ncbi:MAG: Hsp20/alpha crystallin family protein [bacterium]
MDLITVKPRYLLRDLQDEMSRMIEDVFDDFGVNESRKNIIEQFLAPAIELTEHDNNYELKVQLPGINKEHIDIEVSNNNIVIRGERKEEKEENSGNIYKSEFRYGKFLRTVPMPSEVKSDEAKAEFDNGVLKITVPKVQEETKKLNKLKIE